MENADAIARERTEGKRTLVIRQKHCVRHRDETEACGKRGRKGEQTLTARHMKGAW